MEARVSLLWLIKLKECKQTRLHTEAHEGSIESMREAVSIARGPVTRRVSVGSYIPTSGHAGSTGIGKQRLIFLLKR